MRTKSTIVVCLAVCFAFVPAFGQKRIKNTGSEPFALVAVSGANGAAVAHLYVAANESMSVDARGDAMAGAGFYQAEPGAYFTAGLRSPRLGQGSVVKLDDDVCLCALHVDRIGWDKDGELTAISGLQPVFEVIDSKSTIAITSDVKNPKIANGNLYIKFAGHGDSEYWVKLKFGHIEAIGKVSKSPAAVAPPDPPYRSVAPGDGFILAAYAGNDWQITELGNVSGSLTKVVLIGSDKKEIEVPLVKTQFADGRIETKEFGVIIAKYQFGPYYELTATEPQIQKMKEFWASQTKQN